MSTTSGWGRFTWGQAYWNADTTLKTGWGAQAWNDGEWGELKDQTISPTGFSITSSIWSVDVNCTAKFEASPLKQKMDGAIDMMIF